LAGVRPVSKQIIAAIDEMLARLRESERQRPSQSVGDFFENPDFAHLRVRIDEVNTLCALIRSELGDRYGPDSGKIALLDDIHGSDPTTNATVFRSTIDYLTNLRTFVLSTLPSDGD
jgi:hypothetical protein